MWEDLFKDLFGGMVPTGLPGPTDAGMPTQPPTPQLPSTAGGVQSQPGTMQPGGQEPTPAPTPQNPNRPLGQQPAPVDSTGQRQAQNQNLSNKATLSPEMQRALAMMMAPGQEQRMPGAPGAARPQVQPFLPAGQLTQPGARFAPRRGL